MKIAPGKVVTLTYDLCRADGEIIESSDISGPVSFIHGRGAIIKGLDRRLENMEEGQEATFVFPPPEAFGHPQDGPTKEIPRGEFPAAVEVEPGTRFEANMGGGQTVMLEVLAAKESTVTVRFIHPLAGQTVSMSIKIETVREATASERETGRVQSKPPPPPPKRA